MRLKRSDLYFEFLECVYMILVQILWSEMVWFLEVHFWWKLTPMLKLYLAVRHEKRINLQYLIFFFFFFGVPIHGFSVLFWMFKFLVKIETAVETFIWWLGVEKLSVLNSIVISCSNCALRFSFCSFSGVELIASICSNTLFLCPF